MSYSFDKTADDEEKKQTTPDKIRSLTDDYVFCPKCGGKNIFELSKERTLLNYFCRICGDRLNDCWEDFQNEQTTIVSCVNCQQYTFEDQKFCITCGLEKSVHQASKSKMPISHPIGSQAEEGLFIYKEAETIEGHLLGVGAGAGGLQINPKHPQADKMKTALCIASCVILTIVIVFLIIFIVTWEV